MIKIHVYINITLLYKKPMEFVKHIGKDNLT